MSQAFDRPIALALSGGGIRAMAFHLGVLKWMAERSLLEKVARISTVSGGSLLTGLVYQSNDFKWPSSRHFLDVTLPEVSELLCTRSMQLGALRMLLRPRNWKFLMSRSNLLARELIENWGMGVTLSVIPRVPEWSINGTTAENGKRFRFKGTQIGDWALGYAEAPNFPLGCALAVSAAFPIGFGPLAIAPKDFEWRYGEWGTKPEDRKPVEIKYRRLHLYDGGLYDNLGAEPFFHPGTQTAKMAGDYVIVSDAGAPLGEGMDAGPLSPFRVKRLMDIVMEQCRALRVRAFANYLQRNPDAGALLIIGTRGLNQTAADATFAKSFGTSLKKLSRDEFDKLANHGYAVAGAVARDYGLCSEAQASGSTPDRLAM